MPERPFRNKLLQNLSPEIIDRLELREIKLPVRHEIEFPGHSIQHLYFIEEGIGSMTTTFRDGSQVEVGMFGFESAMGVSGLMGTRRSLNRVYMQLGGFGYTSSIGTARVEFARCGKFHDLALRYVQAQLTQATQSAGCNAKHTIEQRLSRWLLLCADRARKKDFNISHEFLADMLGATRSTVAVAASHLREEGLIEYRRADICIPDIPALEKRSCECYGVVKEHLDNYIEFDTGFAV